MFLSPHPYRTLTDLNRSPKEVADYTNRLTMLVAATAQQLERRLPGAFDSDDQVSITRRRSDRKVRTLSSPVWSNPSRGVAKRHTKHLGAQLTNKHRGQQSALAAHDNVCDVSEAVVNLRNRVANSLIAAGAKEHQWQIEVR